MTYLFLILSIINPKLQAKLEKMKPNDVVNIVIQLPSADYNYAWKLKSEGYDPMEYLREYCGSTQKPFVDFLLNNGIKKDNIRQISAANKIFVYEIPKILVLKLEREMGNKTVNISEDEIVATIHLHTETQILGNFYPGEEYISGSMENIRVPVAWARGYRGNGIVIGNLDSGVDVLRHPLLKPRWRKFKGWYDAVVNSETTTPVDSNGHGTGTAGFNVAEYGIGAAPGARIIVVKGLNASGSGTKSWLSNGLNFFANLPESLRPHIISNSWGGASDTAFWDEIRTLILLNVIPVFSIGNSGPNASTSGQPGDYPTVIGVGATYWEYEWVTEYSSRGPAPNRAPWDSTVWWLRPDWNYRKPDIIAPAEPTITTARNGEFQTFNGTSASCPHVAGALALILQANTFGEYQDTARLRRIYRLITDYAYLQGAITTWPNDSFGWGRIDVEKVLNNLPEPKVPHIFITNVRVKDHNNNTISSGEVDTLYITLKNTGANATNVIAEIVYRDPSGITITDGSSNYGTLNRFEEKENSSNDRFIVTMPTMGDTVWTYWTLRIRYQYTLDGVTKTDTIWDFFHLVSDFISLRQRDTLKVDNNIATRLSGMNYNALMFSSPGYDTIISVSMLLYTPTATCTLLIWNDNNGVPLDPPVYTQTFTSAGYPNWTTVTLTTQQIMTGNYWVGLYRPTGSAAPIMDDAGNGMNAGKNVGGSWGNFLVGDFMIRPYVGRAILRPLIRATSWNVNDKIYGNDDGNIDPSERFGLYVSLNNDGIVAVNCTLTLKRQGTYTTTRITPIDTISVINEIRKGKDVATNFYDQWELQYWDNDSLNTGFLWFWVKIKGRFRNTSGLMETYNDSFLLYIRPDTLGPLNTQGWYEAGQIDYILLDICSNSFHNWSFATNFYFGNHLLDSVWVESLWIPYYSKSYICYNLSNPGEFIANLWDDNNRMPGTQRISIASGNEVGEGTWNKFPVSLNLQGHFWIGWTNNASGNEITFNEYNYPLLWAWPGIARSTIYYDGSNWYLLSYFNPLVVDVKLSHNHPTLSYYKPSTWTWPAVLTNTSGTQTLPTIINGCWPGQTIYSHMAFINRSTRDINTSSPRTARETWENYFLLDNYGRWYGTYDNLNAWTGLTYVNQSIYVPGGRHTVMIWGDGNDNVMGNVMNVQYRFWGKQYSLSAPNFPADSSIKEPWVPPMTGPFAGDYPNITAYKLKFPGTITKYYCFAVRPIRMNIASDTIDIDIEVYSDFPTSPYNGYTNFIIGSGLGPGKVDFIVFNDKNYDSLAAGIYNFLSAKDSAFVDFRSGNKYIYQWSSTRVAAAVDSFKTAKDVVKVYNFVVPTTAQYACSVKSLAGTNVGIALFPKGSVFSRSRALKEDDDGGAGVMEGFANISLTAGDTLAVVVWKNDNYEAKAPVPCSLFIRRQSDGYYGGQPLSTHLIEFSYFATYQGVNIMFTTNNIEYVEIYRKSDGSDYELITKTNSSPFIDKNVENGKTYDYKLNFVFTDGYNEEKSFSITYYGITKLDIDYDTKTNRMILYIPKDGEYKVTIYDITGRFISQPVSGNQKYGILRIPVDIKNGIYFVVAEGNKEKKIIKIPLIR